MALSPKQRLFVQEYLVDLNATQASIRAGYSAKTAEQQGPRLLGNVGVAAAIEAAMAKRAEKIEITADRVLSELWDIATADANELVQYRRGACSECYGEEDHDRTRDPVSDCPSCGGEGVGWPYVSDTRKLSETAKRLYAGVKVTKDGIEIKMHDKAAALINVGKHLGMFATKIEHDVKFSLEDLVTGSLRVPGE